MEASIKTPRNRSRARSTFLAGTASALLATSAGANPQGGEVVAGSATVSATTPQQTDITQHTQGVVIDWSRFDIAQGETTRFIQPNRSAVAVNRIGSANPSRIDGTLDANGRVVLINGNGLVIGAGARVNVGSLIATTSDGDDASLASDRPDFSKPGNQKAAVLNQGQITAADGGIVALVAPAVTNSGIIEARAGTVALGGGNRFTVDFNGDGLVSFAAGDAGKASVANSGQLSGQTVVMSARTAADISTGVVSMSGVIAATAAHESGGRIVLDAGHGAVTVTGALRANGVTGGDISIAGRDVTLAGATIAATGANGGGHIQAGGSGSENVLIDKRTTLDASATASGDGGKIQLAGAALNFEGRATATAGAQSGNGGSIETSAHSLQFTGLSDLSAPHGHAGTLLLDPTDLYINTTGTPPVAGASAISTSTLQNQLKNADVVITTNSAGTQAGTIDVQSGFSWSAAHTLTLNAFHHLLVDSGVTIASTGGGSINLHADYTGRGVGSVLLSGSSVVSAANGGNVQIFYNPTSYTTPRDFSTHVKVTGGGKFYPFMLVNSVADLQAMNTNLSGDYAVGRSIDASATANWNAGAGFVPIGTSDHPFTGVLNGQDFAILNLTINRPSTDDVGLLAATSAASVISHVVLTSAQVTGHNDVGALAGSNSGVVNHSYSSGSVTGRTYVGGLIGASNGSIYRASSHAGVNDPWGIRCTCLDGNLVGGLVGYNQTGGQISQSLASGDVTGLNSANTAGLAGRNYGTISNSAATGTIRGYNAVGGLVGNNGGTITGGSTASGNVTGHNYVGGLVGWASGTSGLIEKSFASGAVNSTGTAAGGLAGYVSQTATIRLSSASGNVTGSIDAGGFAGLNLGAIAQSFETGTVSGSNNVGGFVGYNSGGSVSQSYATGAVTGNTVVGGFVGLNASLGSQTARVEQSYSAGAVHGSSVAGASVGENGGEISNLYWDSDTALVAAGVGRVDAGASGTPTGQTTSQLKTRLPSGFSTSAWGLSASINNGFPYLLGWPPR